MGTTFSSTNCFLIDCIFQVIWLWRWIYLFVLEQGACNKEKSQLVFFLIFMGACLDHKMFHPAEIPKPISWSHRDKKVLPCSDPTADCFLFFSSFKINGLSLEYN